MGISIYLHEHAINPIIKNQILVISSLHVNHIIHFKSCESFKSSYFNFEPLIKET